MTRKFQSPGVFTRETDLSFAAEGQAAVGAAIVGSSKKGPAFEPVFFATFDEFVKRMGSLDPVHQASYGARNYLANATALSFVRVLGHADGTSATAGYSVGGITGIADFSGSGNKILAVIHHSGTLAGGAIEVAGVPTDADRFTVRLSADGGTSYTFATTASFLTASSDYIGKVLNTDPTRYDTDGHYLYQVFKYSVPPTSASWHTVAVSGTLTSFEKNFTEGSTPWIMSQLLGNQEYDLFKFHTIADGRATNDEVKVSVANIKPSSNPNDNPWGTFDVIVRRFYDTDERVDDIETFVGLTLDPSSQNYIARRIGDVKEEFDTTQRKMVVTAGSFPSQSRYIRVELNKSSGAPPDALPWGFRGFAKAAFSDDGTGQESGATNAIPALAYRLDQIDRNGSYNPNLFWGALFVSGGVVDRMRALPVSPVTASDSDFSLKHLSASYVNSTQRYVYNTDQSAYEPIVLSSSIQQFTVPFAGGFDGFDLRVENPLDIDNAASDTDIGVVSMKRALDILANRDFIDINLLATPGVHAKKVTDHARSIANDRRDLMYIMDLTGSSVDDVRGNLNARNIDDNYTAAYYPDVKIDDRINNMIVRVAPSAVVIGAYAFSDASAEPWFAPAGLNRGGLDQFNVIDVVDRVDYQDRSDLQEDRINPISSFPRQGIVVWGQKTLQVEASALDRVNVRRLLIFAKRAVSVIAQRLVFEPNEPVTWGEFARAVNPILDRVKRRRGVERFKVVMDSTTNTPDVVDQNIMRGKIFLQPTKAAEFIDLEFVITAAGVEFGE